MKSPVTFVTSFFFSLSSYHAFSRNYYDIMLSSLLVLTTSLFYHYTHNKKIRLIDMFVVHTSLCYGIYTLMSYHYYYYIAMFLVVYMAIFYLKFNTSDYTHATLHFFGFISIILSVEGHYLYYLSEMN